MTTMKNNAAAEVNAKNVDTEKAEDKKFVVKYLLGGYSEGENHKVKFADYDSAKTFLKELRSTDKTFTVGIITYDKATLWKLPATGYGYGFGNPTSNGIDINAELIACIDDYIVDVDTAAEVEIENAGNSENQSAKNTETIFLAKTGAYEYKLENGDGLDEYYFKQKLHDAIKDGAKIKIRNGFTLHGVIDFSPLEMKSVEVCDSYRMTELGDRIDNPIAAIIEYPNGDAIDELQAKIAEIKNRKHKSCIDWNAAYDDLRVDEIFSLQKDFKKFLKLGEMRLAEKTFENLKMMFAA